MKIQNTKNVKANKLKMAVYGASGAGKTTLAKTCPKPFLISLEAGTLSLAGSDVDYVDATMDDNGVTIEKERRLNRIVEILNALKTPEYKTRYETIIIDSLTEIGQCVVDAVSKKYPEAKDNFLKWGEYGNVMRSLIKAFRDLPEYHVLFVALAIMDKDEDGRRFANVDLQGSIGDKFPAFIDLVMFLNVDNNGARKLLTERSPTMIAKDRSGKLAKEEPADIGAIIKKVVGV